jgi:hypothetical protein
MAMQRSSNADELRELIEHGAGLNTEQAGGPPPGQPGRPAGAAPQPPPRPTPPGQHPSPYAQPRPVGTRPGPR